MAYLIETNMIYSNVVKALKKRKERKFLVEHTGYLRLFLEAYPDYKSDVEALLEANQLVMLNSASVSAPDEATTYYSDLTTNIQQGSKWFRESIFPKKLQTSVTSWMIDAFGHSLGNVLVQRAAGLNHMIINRIDDTEKVLRSHEQKLDFKWPYETNF